MGGKTVLILDVGTHKAQEARLLADTSKFFKFEILKELFKRHRLKPKAFGEWRAILAKRERLKQHEMRFCFIEPIMYDSLLKTLKHIKVFSFLRGVTSAAASGEERLFLAKNNLGNSIIETKPNLTGESIQIWNYDFAEVLGWVDRTLRTSPSDILILRINAEGVEKDIIKFLHDTGNSYRVQGLFGSLGDIRKCFGDEEYDLAMTRLQEMGIPYHYFTSNARGWKTSLDDFVTFVETQ